jgi:hypothetical protein
LGIPGKWKIDFILENSILHFPGISLSGKPYKLMLFAFLHWKYSWKIKIDFILDIPEKWKNDFYFPGISPNLKLIFQKK